MAKLYLKFEQAVLKEFTLGRSEVTVGRLPDNLVHVDNLAVSGHHCKLYWDVDHYALEDNNSLNGTFVNNQRITKAALKDGDQVLIGKHTLVFKDSAEDDVPLPIAERHMPMVPALDATMVLDTRKTKEMLAQATAAAGVETAVAPAAAPAAPDRERSGFLHVITGKTDRERYALSGKFTAIGKSEMASIRLKGWFKPKVAAVINQREGKYYIAASGNKTKVKINHELISGQRELKDGDLIEFSGVTLSFSRGE